MTRLSGQLLVFIAVLLAVWLARPAALRAEAPEATENGARRVVHRFDFNEREEGNLESVPKFWEPFRPPGFPKFTAGQFDFDTGRKDRVSFYLASEGRSVAYQYVGPGTPVQPNTSYLIEGYLLPDKLESARACLSAHFLDEYRNPIAESLVRSRYVGGPAEKDHWQRVEMYLPAAPPDARTIGLIAWVMAEPTWNIAERTYRYIPSADVRGGAWFDDITVHSLPRIAISSSSPSNVLPPNKPQELRVLLADYLDASLEGRLTIRSAEGVEIGGYVIPVQMGKSVGPQIIDVGDLDPGIHHATLDVYAGEELIVTRTLRFAILGPLHVEEDSRARPFGVVLDPRARTDPQVELDLLRHLQARSTKLPVWTGLSEPVATVEQSRAEDHLLRSLVREGFSLTGVFAGPPASLIQSAGAYPRPLVEILSDDPGGWRDDLAAALAPSAGYFDWWQLGADNDPGVIEDRRLGEALEALEREMLPYTPLPRLTVPGSAGLLPSDQRLGAECLSLTLPSRLLPSWFASQIELYRGLEYDRLTTYLEPLSRERYDRLAYLADWARRVLLARHGGADAVFVPQPWQTRKTGQGMVTEPTEEYLLLRTIANLITDRTPGFRIRVGPDAEALVFHDESTSVLALWDLTAPPEGRPCAIQLGTASEQIDLWGRATPLPRGEHGRQIVTLSSSPVLVPRVERWLVEFRQSVRLTPEFVDFGAKSRSYGITMENPGVRPLAGETRLEAPRLWKLAPRGFNLRLMPGQSREVEVDLRLPYTEPAGKKTIVAQIALDQPAYYMEVPLAFTLGLVDVEVWGVPIVEGEDLILRHVVANRSPQVLHFRSSASVPGWERQYQPLPNLKSDETVTIEYRFHGAGRLAGRKVRLILRELNDGTRIHNLELTIP